MPSRNPDGTWGRSRGSGGSSWPRWAPAAPAASATSTRSLTITGTASAPTRTRLSTRSSRGATSFRRTWIMVAPPLTAWRPAPPPSPPLRRTPARTTTNRNRSDNRSTQTLRGARRATTRGGVSRRRLRQGGGALAGGASLDLPHRHLRRAARAARHRSRDRPTRPPSRAGPLLPTVRDPAAPAHARRRADRRRLVGTAHHRDGRPTRCARRHRVSRRARRGRWPAVPRGGPLRPLRRRPTALGGARGRARRRRGREQRRHRPPRPPPP